MVVTVTVSCQIAKNLVTKNDKNGTHQTYNNTKATNTELAFLARFVRQTRTAHRTYT